MKNNIGRREFLSSIAMLAAVATAAADARANRPDRLDKRRPLTELTAVAAVAVMRNGDIQAEDYARALLDCDLDRALERQSAAVANENVSSGAKH